MVFFFVILNVALFLCVLERSPVFHFCSLISPAFVSHLVSSAPYLVQFLLFVWLWGIVCFDCLPVFDHCLPVTMIPTFCEGLINICCALCVNLHLFFPEYSLQLYCSKMLAGAFCEDAGLYSATGIANTCQLIIEDHSIKPLNQNTSPVYSYKTPQIDWHVHPRGILCETKANYNEYSQTACHKMAAVV